MKGRKKYIGLSLIIIGIILFVSYNLTGKMLFHSFDEISQIEGAKITSYDDYISNSRYELILLALSFLSFFSGVIMIFVHNWRIENNHK